MDPNHKNAYFPFQFMLSDNPYSLNEWYIMQPIIDYIADHPLTKTMKLEDMLHNLSPVTIINQIDILNAEIDENKREIQQTNDTSLISFLNNRQKIITNKIKKLEQQAELQSRPQAERQSRQQAERQARQKAEMQLKQQSKKHKRIINNHCKSIYSNDSVYQMRLKAALISNKYHSSNGMNLNCLKIVGQNNGISYTTRAQLIYDLRKKLSI